MRACIYARRSTSKLGQNETIGNQIKICTSHAERIGLEIVDVKEDTGSGTDDLNRPEVKELIDDALDGKYECVIMKGISRFYRNVAKGLELVDLLDRNNIRVITIEESYDTQESRYGTGKLDNSKISMFLTFSEMESRKLGDRIKYTQLEKAKAGEWNIAPRPPYGYKYNSETKKLSVIHSEAEIVQLIYELYLEGGYGISKIAKYLNGENDSGLIYPNRNNKDWSYSKVRYILTNETYTGTVVFNKRTKKQVPYKVPEREGRERTDFRLDMVENDRDKWIINTSAHDPIISRELFDKAQSILKTKARNIGVKQSYSLLAGISKCGSCGSGMYLKKVGYRNGKPRPSSYYCVSYAKKGKNYCTSHHIRQDVLEDYIFDRLKELYSNEEELDAMINSNKKLITNSNDLTSKIKEYEVEINNLNDKTDVLLEKNMDGKITDAQFERMNEKYTKEVEKLNNTLNKLKSQQSTSLSDAEKIKDFKRKLKGVSNFENLTHDQKRIMLLSLVEKVTVTPFENNELDIDIKFKFEV